MATTAEHPVIRTHPETGKKILFINGAHTVRFEGMTEKESAGLLTYLFDHQKRDEFTCRFRWQVGSLAFWDNRCAQHKALWDYYPKTRHGYRVTVQGDRPV